MADHKVQTLVGEIGTLSRHLSTNGNRERHSKALISKAQELITALQSPMDHGVSKFSGIVESAVIRTLMTLGVLQAIPDPPASASITDLANATGAQASLLARLLRIVVANGFIQHSPLNDGGLSYSHTPTSKAYSEGMFSAMFSALYGEMATILALPEYFKTHGASEPDGESALTRNPQTWYHGVEGKMTTFELLERDPERVKNFHIMSGMIESIRPWVGFYNFSKLTKDAGDRAVLVDVGGGNGTLIEKVLQSHPDIGPTQCVLQDRQAVIDLAKQRQQGSVLPSGVQFRVHDFFTKQPVKAAKAYHFRAIMHDWSDSVVVRILANVVPAMAPDSKVLIADCIVPEHGVEGLAGMMDMMMLNIGGKERTRKDFEDVLSKAGLKIEEVYPAGQAGEYSGFSVVEAVLM